MSQRIVRLFVSIAFLSAVPGIGRAQDDPPSVSARCLQLPRVDHTESVGDGSILFYMRDGTIYQNDLPHACPGLKGDKPFMYRVMLDRLCDSDIITVLERWGFGFTPGQSCLLGEFEPIDNAAAEALKAAPQ